MFIRTKYTQKSLGVTPWGVGDSNITEMFKVKFSDVL